MKNHQKNHLLLLKKNNYKKCLSILKNISQSISVNMWSNKWAINLKKEFTLKNINKVIILEKFSKYKHKKKVY